MGAGYVQAKEPPYTAECVCHVLSDSQLFNDDAEYLQVWHTLDHVNSCQQKLPRILECLQHGAAVFTDVWCCEALGVYQQQQ